MYNTKMKAAAYRHNEAAEAMPEARKDVAGYLFGLAAECALKQLMSDLGVPGADEARTAANPYYAHFPPLKTILRDDDRARKHTDIRKFVEDPAFMGRWDVRMRYSDGKAISKAMVDRWREDAKNVLQELI